MIKKTDLICKACGYELITDDINKKVICQNCKDKEGKFKRVIPR